MAVAGIAAAHAGARCTAGVDGPTLKLALGVLMLVVAPLLPLRDKFLHDAAGDLIRVLCSCANYHLHSAGFCFVRRRSRERERESERERRSVERRGSCLG